MRRLPLALVSMLLALPCASSACSDDSPPAPPDDGNAAGAGEGGQAPMKPGGGGSDAGDSSGMPEGGARSMAGASAEGGTPPVGDAGSSSDAGSPPLAAGGEGGAGPVAPPDLITSSGGPWPDSLSANCATASALIPCPRQADPFFGQDGTYRINVPTYTANATTLTDSVTGLIWQLNHDATEREQAAALSYCDSLDLAGQTDWRLPSRLEYISLLDEGMQSGHAMPPAVPVLTTGAHWTASATGAVDGDASFVVNDNYGMWTVAVNSTALLARCVRGPALSGSVQVGVDTTLDGMTDLEWQRSALDDTERDWQEALAHCEALEHASKTDWRLPSIKELATIVDESAAEALVIDSAIFGTSQASRYWSSTPTISFSTERFALALETNFGSSPSVKMSELAAARCVRTAD